MNKRFLLVACLLATLGGVAVLLFHGYVRSGWRDQVTEKDILKARRRLHVAEPPAPAAVAPLPASQTIRLAIGSLGLPDDNQNRQLADLITAEMSGVPALELVERQSLDKVLAELQISLSSLVRAKDAIAVGRLLRADWFLLGTGTSVAGTNSIVVRVVDARTGILRDAGVFISSQTPTGLASSIAGFIRQCRKSASSGKQAVYLAIGTFQDLSINSRQAGFPSQLRGYLTAAFQSGPVTLLEREYVETLLQEVHLDMAGLTEEGGTNVPAPMQSAFWMVNGSYQSYETASLQVEVDLEVHRIFGTTKHISLRAEGGEAVNRKIKTAIDQVMNQATGTIIPTRQTEVRAQMASGKDLAGLDSMRGQDLVYLGAASNTVLDEDKAARKRRNAEEALRAFQTVLLLEPTNCEAKLYAAACLRNNTIQRVEEARDYYRQVAERPVQDKWSELAKRALSASFGWRDPEAKVAWFGSAAGSTTSLNAAESYRREAEAARAEVLLKTQGPESQALAEARLWSSVTNAMFGSVSGPMGVEEYVKTFGTNQAVAAQALADWYSKTKSQAPQLAPYLLAAVVTTQLDTNAAVVVEFQHLLENLIRHPDHVFKPDTFWSHVPLSVCEWSWAHRGYRLAATLLEAKVAAAAIYTEAASHTNHVWAIEIKDDDRMRLAFAYLATQEWEKAIRIFETFSDQPFSMFLDGPWGRGGTVIFPRREIDYCRKKLGLPIAHKGPELQMGKPVLQLCRDAIFTSDEQGLWIGLEGQLLHLGFDLKTNLVVNLPVETAAPIAAICVTSSNIWIGTDGGGLHNFNKASHQFRHLGQKDGLLMDKIASLYLSRDALWIGYGRRVREGALKSEGGLGRIDLHTGQITSFMPSALEGPGAGAGQGVPPRTGKAVRDSVLAITEGAPGDIWLLADAPSPMLCRYRTGAGAWDIAVNQACTSLLRDPGNLFVGRCWNYFGENRTEQAVGVSILDLSTKDAPWRELKRPEGLPPGRVTALAIENGRLWVGGFGYIALMDPAKDELGAVAYVQAESVDRLETGGGFLWAQFRCNLYRVGLP
jgi:hypothetical protein